MSPSLTRPASLILVIALAATSVHAADEIGVFFDDQGVENCIRLDQFGIVDAYVLLLQPSLSSGLVGWECSVVLEEVAVMSVSLMGLAIDVDAGETDFQVGLGIPLFGSVVHVATIKVMLTGEQAPIYIFPNLNLPSVEDSPIYIDGSDFAALIPLTPHSITGENLVAGINAFQCFPESKTWAELKTIYR